MLFSLVRWVWWDYAIAFAIANELGRRTGPVGFGESSGDWAIGQLSQSQGLGLVVRAKWMDGWVCWLVCLPRGRREKEMEDGQEVGTFLCGIVRRMEGRLRVEYNR